jgi:hypothetical protein
MTTKKSKLKADLIASITATRRKFHMGGFKTGDTRDLATCGTALCMAGHLEAIRKKLARKLAPAYRSFGSLDHEGLASAILVAETGEQCPLDFMARLLDAELDHITVKQAVAHIKGRSKKWPLLKR